MAGSSETALVVRGDAACPVCRLRFVDGDHPSCPECGLVDPREAALVVRDALPPGHASARTSKLVGPAGIAIAAGGFIAAISAENGMILLAAIGAWGLGAVVAGALARRLDRRRQRRLAIRLGGRVAGSLRAQDEAIAAARRELLAQTARLGEVLVRVDRAIEERHDDAAARERMQTIRRAVDTAIESRRLVLARLHEAEAEVALARWLCHLQAVVAGIDGADAVRARLQELGELEQQAAEARGRVEQLEDAARGAELGAQWDRADAALREVRAALRVEEERYLAALVRDAVKDVSPIANLDGPLPGAIASAGQLAAVAGDVPIDLRSCLARARDEVERCVEEELRLRSEIDAIVEVDRVLAG